MHSFTAPAKINLFLHIIGRREDGFHNLQSAVFFSDIGDEISYSETTSPTYLQVSGPYAAGAPEDDSNLLLKAYYLLKNSIPALPNLSINLTKNLPVAAGLGGGSSDAAAFIRAVISDYGKQYITSDRLTEILESLGSDLPVCHLARPALMEGTGHTLCKWPDMPEFGVLLVNPNIPLSTAKIYQAISSFSAEKPFTTPHNQADWIDLFQHTHNDMQPPAIAAAPEIEVILNSLKRLKHCLLSRMSGSGASCFALFTNREEAAMAAGQLQLTHPQWWVKAGGIYYG